MKVLAGCGSRGRRRSQGIYLNPSLSLLAAVLWVALLVTIWKRDKSSPAPTLTELFFPQLYLQVSDGFC